MTFCTGSPVHIRDYKGRLRQLLPRGRSFVLRNPRFYIVRLYQRNNFRHYLCRNRHWGRSRRRRGNRRRRFYRLCRVVQTERRASVRACMCVCAGKPEAIVSQGNIRTIPESKENIKTDFFIVSPRDKVRTEARKGSERQWRECRICRQKRLRYKSAAASDHPHLSNIRIR